MFLQLHSIKYNDDCELWFWNEAFMAFAWREWKKLENTSFMIYIVHAKNLQPLMFKTDTTEQWLFRQTCPIQCQLACWWSSCFIFRKYLLAGNCDKVRQDWILALQKAVEASFQCGTTGNNIGNNASASGVPHGTSALNYVETLSTQRQDR